LPSIPPEDVGLVVGGGVTIGKEAEKQGFTTRRNTFLSRK